MPDPEPGFAVSSLAVFMTPEGVFGLWAVNWTDFKSLNVPLNAMSGCFKNMNTSELLQGIF